MSFFGRLKSLLFGKNGHDPVQHETQVRRLKDESFGAMDETVENFGKIERCFQAPVETEETPREEGPKCLDESRS